MGFSTRKEDEKRRRLTGGQAAVLLLLFCIPAVGAAVFLWNGIHAFLAYYDRYGAYDVLITEAGARNGVDPALLKAVIWRESKFDPTQIGTKGEIGLMQVMPKFAAADWAKAHRRTLPSPGALADPELNIEIGSWFLGRALRRWSAYAEQNALALCEYNAGYQRADAWKPKEKNGRLADRIDIASTASYVKAILEKQKEYARDFRANRKD